MKIASVVMGILLLLSFSLKHVPDGKPTEVGVWVFAIVYYICATALILVPIYLGSKG